jgi:hypothetical protein
MTDIAARLPTALADRYRMDRELFYRTGAGLGSQLVAATVTSAPVFPVIARDVLFPMADVATATPHSNYDVSPDGRRSSWSASTRRRRSW